MVLKTFRCCISNGASPVPVLYARLPTAFSICCLCVDLSTHCCTILSFLPLAVCVPGALIFKDKEDEEHVAEFGRCPIHKLIAPRAFRYI